MPRAIIRRRITPAAQTTTQTPVEADTKQVLDFISAAFTATGQTEYYNTKEEQRTQILNVHKPMLAKYREFYSLLLLSTINDLNKQLIIYNLLNSGAEITSDQKRIENQIIYQCLQKMQTNRAYKTFVLLADNKVNNVRTRWLARKWLGARKNLTYESVKYKNSIKKMVTHNHIHVKDSELFDFLFDIKKEFTKKIYNDYVKARSDKEAIYKLPYSIAEGFAAHHKIDRKEFLEKIKGKMTVNEKLRLQTATKKVDVKLDVDVTKWGLTKYYKYLYSLDRLPTGHKENIEELAWKATKDVPYQFENVAIIVDNSGSSFGSEEKKYHPIAVAMALAKTIEKISKNSKIYYTNPGQFVRDNQDLPEVGGATNLAVPLVVALKSEPDVVIVISDGYENEPSGMTAQVINAYKRQIDKDNKVMIMQISPVFAAESKTIRQLSELMPNIGIRDERQLGGSLLLLTMQHKKEATLGYFVNFLKGKMKTINFDELPNYYLLDRN